MTKLAIFATMPGKTKVTKVAKRAEMSKTPWIQIGENGQIAKTTILLRTAKKPKTPE